MKLDYTIQAQEVLDIMQETAIKRKHGFIGTEHLLYALATCKEGMANKILGENGVNIELIRNVRQKDKRLGVLYTWT